MGIWYYIKNKTKKEMIFLGRGEPFITAPIKNAMRLLGWTLDDEISVIDDYNSYVPEEVKGFTEYIYKEEKDQFIVNQICGQEEFDELEEDEDNFQ